MLSLHRIVIEIDWMNAFVRHSVDHEANLVCLFSRKVLYTTLKRCSIGSKIEISDADWTGNYGYNKSQIFPPPYSVVMQQQHGFGKHQKINGRDYLVINSKSGDPQLIPVRAPSAFLFQYSA
jgi:hypothetical protein